ncbi:bifunctional tetrahydrofolate synthase/dihydrofolate synthase [Stutzerimonas zhaodongensis]|uniref:Dihydrofolate synthase/folylpolyglutamate synthase n=1 Tax=Stutzerimonas zhaodongensis TaxID=1176257 RepID=A0A3M2HXP4_9GAMM|nr:bifunctional tetrahydrofolate synthase/dihydrofolate synthase [Stutzerimonas zhaodongensis]MCQ2029764.1 bifunctional tetrahydrofolate synthase/dihydrofolate synthase [Stutzerimonas zhaodongensis]MCQ4314679.1 bifunctional tetrahydrofolate synthase/dihydrofolate synthase [Stutzerimonas zhaodongensis]RMH92189.1 bifunctional tetrahydrofolate synthase/dihydrofolate synthase [Stutzerimonas zhaodongensis]
MSRRNLQDWLGYLEHLHPVAIDMGLDRCREVASRLGLTRPARQVVTVTGTNGKGSTCAFIAQMLIGQGKKVGVYSSPHLLRYNERVRLNGVDATDEALCEAFEAVESARASVSLTYFEMGTLAALWLFEREGLDAVVLEVGLGGRLDAVNLVDADVAVVTNIGLDHAEWLGSTRESVALEKAGIFRSGQPAVCGDCDPPETMLEKAAQSAVPLLVRGRDFDLVRGDACWQWSGKDRSGSLLDLRNLPMLSLPLENAAVALQAFALLEPLWQPELLIDALRSTRITGRLDRYSIRWRERNLSVLLDVGHNPHAAAYLARHLDVRPKSGRRLAVFGLLADKDLSGVIDELVPIIDGWAVAPLATARSRNADELRSALIDRRAPVTIYPNIAQALEEQCNLASEMDEILVFGSFYCVAEALAWLDRQAKSGGDGFGG